MWGTFMAVVLAFVATTAGAQSIYRCPGENGQAVFQQTPCIGGTVHKVSTPAMGGTMLGSKERSRAVMDSQKVDEARERREQELDIAVQQRRPAVGMTEAQLLRALGPPEVINNGLYGNGTRLSKQYVYRRGRGQSSYVYTENGIVTSVQWPTAPEPSPTMANLPAVGKGR